MSVPNHAFGCTSRMFATNCQDCKAPVFFFCCSCGSKGFFDRAGFPWPEHKDSCIPYMIRVLRDVEKMPIAVIANQIRAYAQQYGLPIPQAVLRDLQNQERAQQKQKTVIDVMPCDDSEVALEGEIVAQNLKVNFLHRFGYDDTLISRRLFGTLLDADQVEMTLRQPPDAGTGFINQFTVFIRQKVYSGAGGRVGRRVGCVLRQYRLGRIRIWVADQVQTLA